MKNILKMWLVLILMLASVFCIAQVAKAADGDIVKIKVIPDVVSLKLDTLNIKFITKTVIVTHREVDVNGDPTGKEEVAIFMDVVDDPGTVEDETSTAFTDYILAIGLKKKVIGDKSKTKLGI